MVSNVFACGLPQKAVGRPLEARRRDLSRWRSRGPASEDDCNHRQDGRLAPADHGGGCLFCPRGGCESESTAALRGIERAFGRW